MCGEKEGGEKGGEKILDSTCDIFTATPARLRSTCLTYYQNFG